MYKTAVPYPNGQVAAEEMFHLGVIPSDTDFRIFRDYGHIPGMQTNRQLNYPVSDPAFFVAIQNFRMQEWTLLMCLTDTDTIRSTITSTIYHQMYYSARETMYWR